METDSSSVVTLDPLVAQVLRAEFPLIPEKDLVQLSKGSLRQFLVNPQTTELQAQQVWYHVFGTFKSATLSYPHRTAVCNAICSFLESCQIAKVETIRRGWSSEERWTEVLMAYLDRFDDAKSKPMRQVLKTLSKIVPKGEDGTKKVVPTGALIELLSSIVTAQPRQRMKPCMVTLDAFLRKDILTTTDVTVGISNLLSTNPGRILERFWGFYGFPFTSQSQTTAELIKVFILALWQNSILPDAAAATGALLATFVGSLKKGSSGTAQSYIPVWVDPLKQVLHQSPSHVETIFLYVLPPLFEEDPTGFKELVNSLPYEEVFAGGKPTSSTTEISLLFRALQVGKQIGLVNEDGAYNSIFLLPCLTSYLHVVCHGCWPTTLLHGKYCVLVTQTCQFNCYFTFA